MMAVSGFVAFVLLLSGMGVGTLVCGLVPLSLPLSHRMMRVLEVFGAGLLVGAAITVVIPEGSSALFSHLTPAPHSDASVYSRVLHPATAFQPVTPHAWTATPNTHTAHTGSEDESWAWSFITKRSNPPSEDGQKHDTHKDEKTFTNSDAEHRLGSSILFGIILMYIIDQLTSGGDSSAKSEDGTPTHHHHQHHDYAAPPPVRPRLETHRLAKSFHQKTDPSPTHKPLHGVRSKDSFTVFDRAEHAVTDDDLEANIGSAIRASSDPHRRVESTATSTSSDNDLPEDYDDHDQHADLKRVGSSHGGGDWSNSGRTRHDDTGAGAPLLHRQNSFTSMGSGVRGRPRSRSLRSASSLHAHQQLQQTTIVGLLIHATADGIAMGASAQSGDQTLTMVVFFAIMIHKAPAAFGLCAMLMSQRLSRTSIRKAVAVFALASPAGAIVTYVGLAAFFNADIASSSTNGGGSSGIDGKSIGTALAFSGGTFLFVAFHAVLELAGVEADTLPGDDSDVQVLGKWLRIALLIAGACTPRALQTLLISVGGGHGH